MADKPRTPGRKSGKTERGPVRPKRVGGVDIRVLERLAEEGLLNEQGQRLLKTKDRPAPGGFTSVDEQLVHSLRRGPKRATGVPAVARRGPRREAKTEPPSAARPALSPVEAEVAERLQKVMARAGVASRRHSEELIRAGRVSVNGRVVTELGTKVVPGRDRIEVDGRPIGQREKLVYIVMNKPKGYVTTLYDPQNRPKVTDLLEGAVSERVYPVGRLDYDTEGLLLLTNDGDLAFGLMHPARQVKKTYIAKVRGVPGPAKLRALETGVELEDGITAPAEVRLIEAKPPNSATLSIRIHEGRNRQVRRMCEAIGHEVIHLKRTTLGPLHLKDLPVGEWRMLHPKEVAELYRAAGLRLGGKPRRSAR